MPEQVELVSGLFDASSESFKSSVLYCSIVLVLFILLGCAWEVNLRFRVNKIRPVGMYRDVCTSYYTTKGT